MPNNFLFSVPFNLKLCGYSVFMITKEEWKPKIIQEKQAIFQKKDNETHRSFKISYFRF